MQTKEKTSWWRLITLAAIIASCAIPAHAEEDNAAELAKKLANPIASLISVPLQYNFDEYGGLNDGASVSRLNIQPVIPVSLSEEWNLITRTIVPLIDQQDFPFAAMNESGLGDIVASQFFSPKAPTAGGWIWGVGPVELLPTASDEVLGGEQWGIGPTAVALKQTGPWTIGFLTNHIWSVAGDDDRADINATFLQPFVSYITKTKTTFGLLTESTYDWEGEQWSVPVVAQVAQLFKIGPQILQFAVAAKYWAEAPDDGPDGWGFRAQLTFLFPE
ncbi:MAG: transporter [Desulfobulbaceae bacterium]